MRNDLTFAEKDAITERIAILLESNPGMRIEIAETLAFCFHGCKVDGEGMFNCTIMEECPRLKEMRT